MRRHKYAAMNMLPQPINPVPVTVACVHGIAECAVALSMLEAADVAVVVHTGPVGSLFLQCMNAFGGMRLQVPAHQAELAIDILAAFEPVPKPRCGFLAICAFILLFLVFHVPPPDSGFFAARPIARTGRVSFPLIPDPNV